MAFAFCTDTLTKVTIPDCVSSIGDYAFGCCDGLTSVTSETVLQASEMRRLFSDYRLTT